MAQIAQTQPQAAGPPALSADRYRDSIITMIDILGFKELVTKERDPQEILRRVTAVRRHALRRKEIETPYESRSYHFSDTVVRVLPLDSEVNQKYPVGLLFSELIDLVHVQMELIQYRVLLRGGVTLGAIAYDETTLFGPGILSAYSLESQIALYPRVVVDPSTLAALQNDRRLKKDTHAFEDEIGYVRHCLRLDADGFWFVDYLKAAEGECDSHDGYFALLYEHKHLIESELGAHRPGSREVQKLIWLATYHNRVVDEWRGNGDQALWDKFVVSVPTVMVPQLPEHEGGEK
jgi:hypothetical protein